ncbi:2-isopropylmalate synthase [Mycolicibacterium brisbanense]|uniref:2-isopropylmalate synthase LeuA allosteric (dimerisation) domain-containing protein n=1 Tax=Mycolicibacterium brisbanense TaxID=146020 RepID=A0A100W0K0_9MYCO|nr:homocitrate synthase [Mycolicibacterium brisbanense]GAS89427.1 uncharacterized protein RMCB_3523 [Mycolicibacterium brisbanense]
MYPSSATPVMHPAFAASFAAPLPRGVRAAAESASWDDFLAEYAPSGGPLRMRQWSCTDARPGYRLGPQSRRYQATIAVGDTVSTSRAAASGPIAALTAMLYDRGIALETTSFHQLPTGGRTATFLQGSDGTRSMWAMGLDDDPELSALRAVIACVNRLMTA